MARHPTPRRVTERNRLQVVSVSVSTRLHTMARRDGDGDNRETSTHRHQAGKGRHAITASPSNVPYLVSPIPATADNR
jgi:hypothetical protein